MTTVVNDMSQVLGGAEPMREPLLDVLERELSRLGGERIPRHAWDFERVPAHLSMTFQVADESDHLVDEGKDLDGLKRQLAAQVRSTIAAAARDIEQSGSTHWSFGEVPRELSLSRNGQTVISFPALVDEGDRVALRVFDTPENQTAAMWTGTRRLLRLNVAVPARAVKRRVVDATKLALVANPYETTGQLVDDCIVAALDELMIDHGAPVWAAAAFARLSENVSAQIESRAELIAGQVERILMTTSRIDRRLAQAVSPTLVPAYNDMVGQRAALITDGFVSAYGAPRLDAVVRYLDATMHRLDTVEANPARDRERMVQVHRAEQAYSRLLDRVEVGGNGDGDLERIGWLIEELRVGLFAQQLGTPEPVSIKRVLREIKKVR